MPPPRCPCSGRVKYVCPLGCGHPCGSQLASRLLCNVTGGVRHMVGRIPGIPVRRGAPQGWAQFCNEPLLVFSGYSSSEFSALLLASVPPLPRGGGDLLCVRRARAHRPPRGTRLGAHKGQGDHPRRLPRPRPQPPLRRRRPERAPAGVHAPPQRPLTSSRSSSRRTRTVAVLLAALLGERFRWRAQRQSRSDLAHPAAAAPLAASPGCRSPQPAPNYTTPPSNPLT